MEIWLKNDDYNIRFPVLPSEYTISSSSNNTSVNVSALSEVTLIGNRNLQEVSFETFFPAKYNDTYCDIKPEYKPKEYREIFEKMKRSGVCKLTLSGAKWSKQVTIEQLDAKETDGTGDITIAFSFKEYVGPKVTKIKKTSSKSKKKSVTTKTKRTTKTVSANAYTVKAGDTLSRIAMSQTGDSANWRAIYSDNKSVIGSDPNRIRQGQKLKIRAF